MKANTTVAIFLATLMVWYPVLGMTAGNPALGKVVPIGPADLDGTRMTLETTLYAGDTVSTLPEGLALVLFPQGDQLHVGPASAVQLTHSEGAVLARLERGALLARSGSGQTVAVRARGLVVTPQAAARYEVALAENGVVVSTQDGTVTVQSTNQTFTVPAGKAMRFEVVPAGMGIKGGSETITGIILAGAVATVAIIVVDQLNVERPTSVRPPVSP